MKKIILPAFASVMLLGSCTDVVYVDRDEAGFEGLLSINVGIDGGATSRAAINGTQFADGAALGIFVTGKQANVKATNNGGVWTLSSDINLEASDGNVDVYAYYPYSAGLTNVESVPVTVAATQTTTGTDNQTDYMWAKTTASRSNAQANLTMKHALAEVSFRFNNVSYEYASGTKEGNITEVGLINNSSNAILKAGSGTLNAKTGVITTSATASDLMVVSAISLFDAAHNAIAVGTDAANILSYPVTAVAAGDIKAAITIDGMTYTAELPEVAGGYAAGNRYVYPVNIKQVTQTPGGGTLGTTANPTGYGTPTNPTDGEGNPLVARPGTSNPVLYDYPYVGGYPLYDNTAPYDMLYPDGTKIADDPTHPESHMHAPGDVNKPITEYANGQPILGGDSENPIMLNPDGTPLKTSAGQTVGDDSATGVVGPTEGGIHSEYVFYLPSGNSLTDGDGNMLYPDGTKVSDDPTNSGGHIPSGATYSNGQSITDSTGGMLYPNGQPVLTDNGNQVGTSSAAGGNVGPGQTGGNIGGGTSPAPGSGAFDPVKISIGVVSIEPWVENVQPNVDLVLGGS